MVGNPDPLTRLRERAKAVSSKLGIEAAKAAASVDAVEAAFGADWLRDIAESLSGDSPLPSHRHRLGAIVAVAGVQQIAEIVELADYLGFAAPSTRYSQILSSLKASSQFDSTILQLALASRFARAGAVDIELEPPAEGNRLGDFLFSINDQDYIAECYQPRDEDGPLGVLYRSGKECLFAANALPIPTAIAIALSTLPMRTEDRKELKNTILRLANQLVSATERGIIVDTLYEELPLAKISVVSNSNLLTMVPLDLPRSSHFPKTERKPDEYWYNALIPPRPASPIVQPIPSPPRAPGIWARLGMWFPDELARGKAVPFDAERRMVKLGRRIEHKIVQTRGPQQRSRLMIVESVAAVWLPRMPEEVIRRFANKLLRGHERMAGVLLVSRVWSETRHTFGYHRLILVSEHRGISESFFQRL